MFEKEAEEYVKAFTDRSHIWSNDKLMQLQLREAYKDGAELGCKKANEELEQKISVLLSCKNCPENKDGLICQKEYENKCLAQKIQFIKELQQENTELKSIAEFQQSSNMTTHFENKKLKEGLAVGSTWNKALNSMNKSLEEERDKFRNMVFDKDEQLTEAKKVIEELYNIIPASMSDYAKEPMEHARKFMTEE